MKVAKVVAITGVSWLPVALWLDRENAVAALSGMIGPLVMVAASWTLTDRTYRRNPARVTSMMVASFGAKMVFVGAYVAIMLGVVSLRPVPFVMSFTAYFIALYAIEALYLRRLLAGGLDAPR
jgi:hypothetical protein